MEICLKPQFNEDEKPTARLIPGGPRLKSALEDLLSFPEMPFQEMSPPLAYIHIERQEKHAERFIELAADFVRALGHRGGSEKVRTLAAPFARLTGQESRYQDLRTAAYKILLSAFTTPTGMAERLSVRWLRGDSTHGSHEGPFVNWVDVEKYLGDADSVLRFPSEAIDYCHRLIEFLSYPHSILIPLGYELRKISEQVEGTHQRGIFLLVAAYDAVGSLFQNAGPHRSLMATIVTSPETMVVAKAAAEDLLAGVPADGGRSRPKAEKPAAIPEKQCADMPCPVSLRMVAPLVGRKKHTLANYKEKMPPPDIPGGDGKTHFWDWQTLRPWLEETFDTKLPERFPGRMPPRSS